MTFNPGNDIHVLSLDQGATPRPFVATEAVEYKPTISPDGHWMAYLATVSEESAKRDLYVVRFPEGTGKVQVTSSGSGPPLWSRDSRELYFSAPPGVLKAVAISGTERAEVGPARTLFPLNDLTVEGLHADGMRFFGVHAPRVDPPTDIVVAEHWLQELTRLVPQR
jgi:hypothetical protein